MKKDLTFKIRIIWLLILFFLISFVVIKYIVPGGEISYQGDLLKKDYFIANLTPKDRVKEVNNRVVVIEEPVYFSLQAPRYFQEAEVELSYRFLTDDYDSLRVGFLADDKLWRYLEKPLENKNLENLINEWPMVVSDNGYIFLQRDNNYNSLKEFLDSDFERDELAIFNLDKTEVKLPNFKMDNVNGELLDEENGEGKREEVAASGGLTIPFPLQGDQQIFVYSFGEEINLKFDFVDINESKGADSFEIKVYYEDQIIKEESFEDDGNILDNESSSEEKQINFFSGYLSEGVYKIEIRANSDIVINNLLSSTRNLVFVNKINLAKVEKNSFYGKENITVYTNGNFLKTLTTHPESMQEITVQDSKDRETFNVEETYTQDFFSFGNLEDEIKEIKLGEGGILLANNDLFFIKGANFFDPRIKDIAFLPKESLENINYVIAKYEPVENEDSWSIARATFPLGEVWQEDNKYSVLLSIQGIDGNSSEDILEIDSIRVKFKGTNLWEKIKQLVF